MSDFYTNNKKDQYMERSMFKNTPKMHHFHGRNIPDVSDFKK